MDSNRKQAEDIASLVQRISSSEYNNLDQHQDPEVRKSILQSLGEDARKLAFAVEDPYAAYWGLVRRCALLSPIKVAQDLGIFETLEGRENATAERLSKESGAEKPLIARMLRPLTAEGLLNEVDEETYTLTARGKPFASPHHADAITFAIHFMPVALSNPVFFQENGYREPQSHGGLDTPLAFHFKKSDYGFFDYLNDFPEIQEKFGSAMKAGIGKKRLSSSVYPFGTKLQAAPEDAIAFVDVGGNKGHSILDIKQRHSEIKGRFVLQDLQPVLDNVRSDELEGIEVMAHDIFIKQPIKGAYMYHLKRIMHDWGDDKCRSILTHIVEAMNPNHSRVLIVDVVLPNRNASFLHAMGDHSMITFGGKERSERQWHELLESVGLYIEKIWAGDDTEAAIECRKA